MSVSRGQYLLLETRGRRTGVPHRVILRYVLYDGVMFVFPEVKGRQDWLLNIRAHPEVLVMMDDGVYAGRASVSEIADKRSPVLRSFTRKYGKDIVRSRYWGTRFSVSIEIVDRLSGADPDRLVYTELEAAFDGIAEEYDSHIYGNPVNSYLRALSVGFMKQVFSPGDTVVEIGCGTGTETLALARHGVSIVATDISSKMLKIVERKALALGLSGRVVTAKCSVSALAETVRSLGYNSLDGAYCTYGAFNTEPDPRVFVRALTPLLRPGGKLVLGVWNRYCGVELFGYLLRGRPRMAFARVRNPVPVGSSRFCVTSYAYSRHEVRRILSPEFREMRVVGACVILPASNLTRYIPHGRASRLLSWIDARFSRTFPMNSLGDHFLGEYTYEP